jgi:hypothetical protein
MLRSFSLLIAGLLVPGSVFPVAAAEKDKATAPKLLPGKGVAGPDGKVGYVPNPAGGIDALDLATGKVLWQSTDANRPLAATATRLYAQAPVKDRANLVRVIGIDAANGKRLLESEPVGFPDWVSVAAAYGRSFTSSARLEGNNLLYSWEARAFYAGGARPSPEKERRERRDAAGTARVDLDSGKVVALADKEKEKPVSPGSVGEVKLKDRTYSLVEEPVPGGKFLERRLFLRAADAAGAELWRHQIAAPVFLPPKR